MNMKRFLAILLAALMVCALAACGGNDTPAPGASDAGSTPAPGGSSAGGSDAGRYLNVMLGTNVMSLDTNLATDGDSFEVIADCIDGLMQMDAVGGHVGVQGHDVGVQHDVQVLAAVAALAGGVGGAGVGRAGVVPATGRQTEQHQRRQQHRDGLFHSTSASFLILSH